jgi:transcriptional regulator with XRE-family HTH domain
MDDNLSMKLKLSENLSRILRDRRMTLREVSEGSGVSISTLSEWSSGRVPRSPLHVAKVAKALKVSLYSLLFGSEDEFGRTGSSSASAPVPVPVMLQVKGDRTYEVTIKRVLKRKGES